MAEHENYDECIERRLAKQEELNMETRERTAHIEACLAQLATKTELSDAKLELHREIAALRVEMQKGFANVVRWVIGTSLGIAVAGITVMTFVLNNATPKAAPVPAQPSPVVIYLPAPVSPTPAAPAAPR